MSVALDLDKRGARNKHYNDYRKRFSFARIDAASPPTKDPQCTPNQTWALRRKCAMLGSECGLTNEAQSDRAYP